MINLIAKKIATSLSDGLFWADTCVGIVTTMATKSTEGEQTLTPVYINDKTDCNGSDYISLVPDSSKDSMIYMEIASEPSVVDSSPKGTTFEATLMVVCWYNYNKINATVTDSDLLMANLIDNIPMRLANDGFTRCMISISGGRVKDKTIFNKYSYDELANQYLMYPYDFFSVLVDVTYTIPKSCILLEEDKNICAV